MTTISINRALTLIEKFQDTLNTTITNGLFVAAVTNSKPLSGAFKSTEEVKKRLQKDTDKVTMSFEQHAKLKVAIQESNLKTKVMFCGEEVSITHLLAIKQTFEQRKMFLRKVRSQTIEVNSLIEKSRNNINTQLENVAPESRVKVLEDLERVQLGHMLCASNVSAEELIQKLEDQVSFLTSEVDFLLSESNVNTMIEVDFTL